MIALTGEELLAWIDTTAEHWRRLLEAHENLLTVPCDVNGVKTVGELLQHIVAVQLRYAERLAGLPETSYEAIKYGTVAEIFATHTQSTEILRGILADPVYDWIQVMKFTTRSRGELLASPKTIFVHALMHGIRHYAQLATLVRQHGVKPDWPMDYLFMDAKPA